MSRTFVRMTLVGALLIWAGVGTAMAQPADMRTYFTFSGPVAIPGVTLPAGKYLFRLADTSSRDVVQILSADGKKPYAMFFIQRAQRFEASAEPEVRFMETASDMPKAIRTWWYPGERSGYEFVYPREQARRLAKGSGQPVLATLTEPTPQSKIPIPEVIRISPAGEETKVVETTPPPFTPTGPTQMGELAPPTLMASAGLPKTASTTPVIALAGVALLLGVAFARGMRLVRG